MATNYSDETFDTLCSTCQRDNKQTEGDVFCLDCQDYYCSKCLEFHKKLPVLSGHKLIGKSEFHSKMTKGSLPIVPTERCKQHSAKVVDMYCTDHKIVACHMCMTLEHASCKKLYVPEHIESLMKFLDINGCSRDCADVGLAAKEQIKVIEQNLKTLKDKKGNALNELKSFKKELIVWLDKVEKRAIEKLDAECAVIESKWSNTITGLQRDIEDMNQCISKLNCAAQNQSQQFVCVSLCQTIALSAKQQTQEIHPYLKDIECMFTPCLELKALIKSHDILGTSSVALNHSQSVTSLQSINNRPTSGKELADLMHVGARVVPGNDWNSLEELEELEWLELELLVEKRLVEKRWLVEKVKELVEKVKELVKEYLMHFTSKDVGSPAIGTVVAVPPQTEPGWIDVKWDTGKSYRYRMGFKEKYDVKFAY